MSRCGAVSSAGGNLRAAAGWGAALPLAAGEPGPLGCQLRSHAGSDPSASLARAPMCSTYEVQLWDGPELLHPMPSSFSLFLSSPHVFSLSGAISDEPARNFQFLCPVRESDPLFSRPTWPFPVGLAMALEVAWGCHCTPRSWRWLSFSQLPGNQQSSLWGCLPFLNDIHICES